MNNYRKIDILIHFWSVQVYCRHLIFFFKNTLVGKSFLKSIKNALITLTAMVKVTD